MPSSLLFAALAFTNPTSPVSSVLTRFVEEGKIPGAVVAVADRERILEIAAVGTADFQTERRMRRDTLFWIASMTKSVTAAALVVLVDEGKLALDDPVAEHLPEFGKTRFTVRDLLRHTSGLPLFSPLEAPREDGTIPMLPLWAAVRGYAMTAPAFEPGARWSYSNAGFNTAGRLIEVVSGQTYESFLQRRLLGPLGMRDTTFSPSRSALARLAKSYRLRKEGGFEEARILLFEHPLRPVRREPMPSGGLFSTAADVARFCQLFLGRGVFRGRRLLSESAVTEMTRNQVPSGLEAQYGLGWFTTPAGNYLSMGAHGTIMIGYPKEGRAVVILLEHATLQAGDSWAVYNPITEAALKMKR